MASILPVGVSTAAPPLQNLPLSPTALSKTSGPAETTTSVIEDSNLTSESSVPPNGSEILEGGGHKPESLPAMAKPENQNNSSENGDTFIGPSGISHVRVRQDRISVETLRAYHIAHYPDKVSNFVGLLAYPLTFDRT